MLDVGRRDGQSELVTAIERGTIDPAGAPRVSLAELTLLPPIPRPSKVICVGVNYDEHRKEMGRAENAFPVLFTRFADTLVGHGQALVRPPESVELDYEGELAVVIGRRGRRIPEERALEWVLGYSCFDDATIRDWQRHTHQFTPGKNFPKTGGFGPHIVTLDEISNPLDLALRTRVDGTLVQSARTSEMVFSVPKLLAYISRFTDLAPGDVIATGTPSGVGARRSPPFFLRPGSSVEVELESVGLLLNTVVSEEV